RPRSNSTMRMITISPSVPLGAYPQWRLCGHAGTAPRAIKRRMTMRMVITLSSEVSRVSLAAAPLATLSYGWDGEQSRGQTLPDPESAGLHEADHGAGSC